jgi:hypothetical protein
MKVTVIRSGSGDIVGTARHSAEAGTGAGAGGPVAGPDQRVDVIDVPDDLADIEDTGELHDRLRTFLDT